jgi:predicted nucleic acid-binding protein
VTGIVLDTNVLVSYLIEREPDQQRRADRLLRQAADRGFEAVLPQIVTTELVFVLTNLYHRPAGEVAEILRDLLSLPGVQGLDDLDWQTVLALWPERIPSFADAAVAAVAKRHRLAVATFDRAFVKRLRREGIEVADL